MGSESFGESSESLSISGISNDRRHTARDSDKVTKYGSEHGSKHRHGSSHGSSRRESHRDHRDHRDHSRHRSHTSHVSRSHHHRHHDRHHRHHRHHSEHGSKAQEPAKSEEQKEMEKPVEFSDEYGDWVIAKQTRYLYDQHGDQEEHHSASEQGPSQAVTGPTVSSTESKLDRLNRLKAAILKAEVKGDSGSSLKLLNEEYAHLLNDKENDGENDNVHIIDQEIDRLSRIKTASENASIQEMVQEEIASKIRGDRLDAQFAEQIGKDAGYEDDEDYISENADKLSRLTDKSEANLRNQVINKSRQLQEALSNCSLCLGERSSTTSTTTVISMATSVYMSLAPCPAIAKYSCVIVPMEHHTNTLECDDDEWEEIRNYMKALSMMWQAQGQAVIFYENAVSRSPKQHACIFAVPISQELLASAPGFFQEAFVTSDEEWSSHRKVIDTRAKAAQLDAQSSGSARHAFRASIAKEAPYFHVWFNINGGMGHIVENTAKWPRGDLFAREILGGMLQKDMLEIRKKPLWQTNDPLKKGFQARWSKYEWANVS